MYANNLRTIQYVANVLAIGASHIPSMYSKSIVQRGNIIIVDLQETHDTAQHPEQ